MSPDHSSAENVKPSQSPAPCIQKRDGRHVPFEAGKISAAILKAGRATGEFGQETAHSLMLQVLILARSVSSTGLPTVEEVQDLVEEVLIASPFRKNSQSLYTLS